MLLQVTIDDVTEAYKAHESISYISSRKNPIALALAKVYPEKEIAVNSPYIGVCSTKVTTDGLTYYVTDHVGVLPCEAIKYLNKFGISLIGKETKQSFDARKALRRTSSDHEDACIVGKSSKFVGEASFEIDVSL